MSDNESCSPACQQLLQELRASEAKFRGIIEAAADAVFIVDTVGLIVFCNTQAAQLFGYKAAELLGMPIEALVPERFCTAHRMHRMHYSQKPHTRPLKSGLDLLGRRKDNQEFPLEISLSPLQTTEGLMIIAIVRDITERKQAEEQLKAYAKELERANADLKKNDQYKDNFLSIISHELRTPLNFIVGFASLLEDEICGAVSKEQSYYVKKILEGADHMVRLVDDLLDAAKIQAGKLVINKEPIVYETLVEDAISRLFPLAMQKELDLRSDLQFNGILLLDPQRIMQVLTNLLANAIKFTTKGG
ncbi:MAG: PAS domain S-box protein, partial [Cyanobacteria bacterium NC_groundwater_1444_Ag_S-0.65um_54_12]|nr:PAS domain S-box protein [Cyanobacteria bacterium NC_groundwater_1444_Ag_S-0.65um_54_12]